MELKAYMKSLQRKERAEFLRLLSCHPLYVYSISSGKRRPGPELAREIVSASRGKVRLCDLRPDIWPRRGKSSGDDGAAAASATDPACVA